MRIIKSSFLATSRLRPTRTDGSSTQPRADSCDDPAQNLHLFPPEARSLIVGQMAAFGGGDTAELAGGLRAVLPVNFGEFWTERVTRCGVGCVSLWKGP